MSETARNRGGRNAKTTHRCRHSSPFGNTARTRIMRQRPPILREKAFTARRLYLLHNLLDLLGVYSGVVGGIAGTTAIGAEGRCCGARRMPRIAPQPTFPLAEPSCRVGWWNASAE